MKHPLLLFISILALVIFMPRAKAAEVELQPTVDTTIKKSAPDTSFATAPSLDALYDGGTDYFAAPQDVHEAYFKFDLSSIPANKFIVSAKLKVSSFGESTYGFSDIRFRQVLAEWNDQTTWNSRPAYAGESVATLDVSHNQFPPEIDITPLTKDWYTQSTPNHGLVMRPYGDGNYQTGIYTADDAHISSKEGPNPPRLVVTYSDTPPPTPSPSPSSSLPSTLPNAPGLSPSSSPDVIIAPTDQNGSLESSIETITYHVCSDTIRSLKAEVSTTQAKVLIELRASKKVSLYYSPTSRVTPSGARDKVAKDATTNAIAVESSEQLRHELVVSPLQAETQYFFSLRGEGITDCEHAFKTLSSIAAIRGAQAGIKNRTDGSTGSILSRLNTAAAQILTQGNPVSGSTKAGIAALGVTLLTLGQATAALLIAGFRGLRQTPYSLLARFLQRKNRVTWGRVISSHNSRGVAHALVSLLDLKTGKLVDRTVSDQLGLYGFITNPGKYRATVVRGGFVFPSILMPYGYQGTPFNIESQDGTFTLDIPMDASEYAHSGYRTFTRTFYLLTIFRIPLIVLGLVFCVISLITNLTLLSWILTIIFIYLAWREYKFQHVTNCEVHIVDAKGKAVAYVQILIRGKGGIKRQLTNIAGLAYIQLPRGEYDAKLATLPIANRPEVHESQQSFHVTKRIGLEKITLTLS